MGCGRASILGVAAAVAALVFAAVSTVPAVAHPRDGRHHTHTHTHGHAHGHGHGIGHRDAYVALGDSYTSGPLIPDQVDAACGRSNRNYPSLVAQRLRGTELTDVSCGGATTAEMWKAQGGNPPQL